MKEHPDIVKFCHFSAYVRTRSAGILRGLTPWHTDFGTKSSVLHLVRGVQAPGTHVRSDYSQTRHIGGRPSSHKANLIPQSKRQDTTIIVIPCLCSFTVPSSPSAEPPINKKRTRTLFRKESGSSTNCMVGAGGFEPPKLKAADLQSVPIGHSGTRPYSFVAHPYAGRLVYFSMRREICQLSFLLFFSKFKQHPTKAGKDAMTGGFYGNRALLWCNCRKEKARII